MRFKFLPIFVLPTYILTSNCQNLRSYNYFESFSHNFYEIERNDAELMDYYNEWGNLPRLITGHTLVDVLRRLHLRAITQHGDHLVKVEHSVGNYKVIYIVHQNNDGSCRIYIPRALKRNGDVVRNLDKIDPIIFMQPFMVNRDLNLIHLDDSWFSDSDRAKMCEAGFVKNRTLDITRENFARYLFRRFSERNANLLTRF